MGPGLNIEAGWAGCGRAGGQNGAGGYCSQLPTADAMCVRVLLPPVVLASTRRVEGRKMVLLVEGIGPLSLLLCRL